MKIRAIATLLSVIILGAVFCACESSEGKSAYKPPAEVFDVKISGTSEPQIDGVRFTYDSKARIDTVTFTYDGYEYKQEYSYDTDQVVIKTIYETNVIEEKVIKYVDIPVESGFTTVDGYFIRVTNEITDNGFSMNKPLSDYLGVNLSILTNDFGGSYYYDTETIGMGQYFLRFNSFDDIVFDFYEDTDLVGQIVVKSPEKSYAIFSGVMSNIKISDFDSLEAKGYTVRSTGPMDNIEGIMVYQSYVTNPDGIIALFEWIWSDSSYEKSANSILIWSN